MAHEFSLEGGERWRQGASNWMGINRSDVAKNQPLFVERHVGAHEKRNPAQGLPAAHLFENRCCRGDLS